MLLETTSGSSTLI